MLRGNKGEWSELYVLLKLVAEGKVYGADKDLNRVDDIYYNILRMIKKQTHSKVAYERINNTSVTIINEDNGEVICSLPIIDFQTNSQLLLSEIERINNKKGAFEIPKLSDFSRRIHVNTLATASTDKADILIKIHDYKTGSDPTLGFSIKSMLGSPSTLINAGTTTNFIYELIGEINDNLMEQFNSLFRITGSKRSPDLIKRFELLNDSKIRLMYRDMQCPTFKNNLILIDSLLPSICSSMLIEYYCSRNKDCKSNILKIASENPLGYETNNGQPFYQYKFRKMLAEAALGMKPSSVWTGNLEATGGYLVVKEDGEILCYHLYNRVQFEEYLLSNTRLETASTKRHKFGYIYKEGEQYYIKLNMQIRFIK